MTLKPLAGQPPDGNGNAKFTFRVTPQFDVNVAATEPGTAGPGEFGVNP